MDAQAALDELRAKHEELRRAVSHDLRNPLVALLLQAQMLERSLDDKDPRKKRVTTIIDMTRELSTLIGQLADRARTESDP